MIPRPPIGRAADLVHLVPAEFIQGRLEVVENDGVGETLEDEGELPEWVDALGRAQREALGHGGNVDNDEDDGQAHTDEHDCEARRYPGELDEAELVAVSNVPHEVDSREDPPRIALASVSSCFLAAAVGKGTHRNKASYGRVWINSLLMLLKKAKLAYISNTQYGCTMMTLAR